MGDDPRQDRIWSLFEAALDRPPEQRASFLARHADDPDLRAEVEGLLRGHDREDGLLDRTPPGPVDLPDEGPELEARLRSVFSDDYAVVRELGRGGMSFVYLAWERKHQRRVVLKVLRPRVAAAHGSERFEREATLVARLSHPNIVPLIDSGVRDGLAYFVMPYIDGETLRSRLRRTPERWLPLDRVLTLLRDVAAALDFAHVAGVVHRDLKPDNVLLAGPHAYLFDFGIARATRTTTTGGRALTHDGAFVGTPGYAAPEQVRGGPVGPRADLWAWGVMAWELLTGAPPPPPIDPTSSPPTGDRDALLRKRPEVPAAVAAIVARCLRPDPADRPESAADLLEAFDEVLSPADRGAAAPATERDRRRGGLGIGGLTVAGLAAAALIAVVARPRDTASTSPPGPLAQPVAVAPFQSESSDSSLALLGRFAGDWITQGIQGLEGVRVVPWPASLGASTEGGDDVVDALVARTGAGTVISGSIYDLDGRLRFRAEVVDPRSGLVVSAPEPISVPPDSADTALRLLVDRIRSSLAIATDARLSAIPGLARRPPRFESYRAFDRGMEHYLAQEYGPATDAFQQAFEQDTTFGSALVYAALTAMNRGRPARADSLLERLRPRLDRLPTAERARWEAARAVLDHDAARAHRAFARLAELAPGSRAPYNVAYVAMGMNRPEAALQVLESVDPDRGELRGWAQYWTQLAHARHLTGDFAGEVAAAAEMVRRYPERRIARVLEVRGHAAAGRLDEVRRLLQAAETLAPDTYWSAGAAGVVAAEELRAHGHDGWRAVLARAEEWLDDRLALAPDHRGHRYWKASAAYDARRWAEARRRFSALHRDSPANMAYRAPLALASARAGDPAGAAALLADSTRWDRGELTVARARLAALSGDADATVALLGQAFSEGVGGWSWVHASGFDDFAPVREDPRVRSVLAGTR